MKSPFKTKYCIEHNINFSPNMFDLSNVYLPVIGSRAFSLYIFLSNQRFIGNVAKNYDIKKIMSFLSFSFDEVMSSRKMLEAYGLLRTYVEENHINKENILFFSLFNPLSFSDFCINNKFKSSLLNKIGIERFQELEFLYSENKKPRQEIIEDYSDIFNEINPSSKFSFDFDSFNIELSKLLKCPISFNDDIKFLIEHYFTNYNLTINEIQQSIFNSCDFSSDVFSIEKDIFEMELSNRANEKNSFNKFNIIEFDRIENFFTIEHDDVTLKKMFSIYKNTRPEDFLTSIQKHNISSIEVSIIRKLRNEFHLSNELINIIIDFSINKTHGRLNHNYIFKVAKSINILNCNNCKKAYNYFLSLSNRKQYSSDDVLETNDIYVNLFN